MNRTGFVALGGALLTAILLVLLSTPSSTGCPSQGYRPPGPGVNPFRPPNREPGPGATGTRVPGSTPGATDVPAEPLGGTTPDPGSGDPGGGTTPDPDPPGGDTTPSPETSAPGPGPDITAGPEPRSGGTTSGPRISPPGPGGIPVGPRAPRGHSGRRRGRTATLSIDSWEYWWAVHQDHFLWTGPDHKLTGADAGSHGTERLEAARIFEALEQTRTDLDCDGRMASVLSLAKTRELAAFGPILRTLKDDCHNVRATAVLALGLLGDPLVVPVLTEILNDRPFGRAALGGHRAHRQARAHAALALGLSGSPEAISPLVRSLRHDGADLDIALSAVLGLGVLEDPAGAPALRKIALDRSRDRRLRAHALAALGRVGDRTVLPDVTWFLRDDDADMRRSAVLAAGLLADSSDEKIVSILRGLVERDRDALTTNWALIALGRIGGEPARRTLLETIREERSSRQVFGAFALALMARAGKGHPGDAQLLRRTFVGSRSSQTRCGLAVALGLMGDLGSARVLRSLVAKRTKASVRGFAAIGLALMNSTDSAPTILHAARETGKELVSLRAARALGHVGHDGTTRSLLTDLEQDRKAVEPHLALGLIGDRSATAPLCRSAVARELPAETRLAAVNSLGFLAERSAADRAILARAKLHCNYGLPFGTLSELLVRE